MSLEDVGFLFEKCQFCWRFVEVDTSVELPQSENFAFIHVNFSETANHEPFPGGEIMSLLDWMWFYPELFKVYPDSKVGVSSKYFFGGLT